MRIRKWENKMIIHQTFKMWDGRKGYKPEAIVLHITQGTMGSVINTIDDNKTLASYHYVVDKTGRIYKFVDPEDTAWHAGVIYEPSWELIKFEINPNYYTIGIGLEGFEGEHITILQYVSLVLLCLNLCEEYKIEPNETTIIYHNEINKRKRCPANYVSKQEVLFFLQLLYNRNNN
jgi:N-acetylmuramoyl-L-alanine amidase